MKKFLRSTAIISVLAVVLTGCGEQENSRVLNIYGGTQSSAVNAAPLAQNQVKSEANESADNTGSASVVGNAENADPSPSKPTVPDTDEYHAPKDYIPDSAYDAFDALIKIVDTARTVEIFAEEFARYNEEFPDYAIDSFEITDGGEPVTSGLLKDGMSVYFYNADGSSHSQAAVRRAPKDIIPDDAAPKNGKDADFPDIIQPQMEAGSFEDSLRYIMLRAETVEDLERNIAEMDTDNRVIGVKVTKNSEDGMYSKSGVTVTEGTIEDDMTVSVTYDDNRTGLQYYVGHFIDRYYGQIISTGEFEKGIWDAIETAETVEELKRLIAEHDIYERIDSVNVYTDGSMTEEVTEGAFTSGLRYYIEYDNRRSNMYGVKE